MSKHFYSIRSVLMALQESTCFFCPMDLSHRRTLDHLIPRSIGGTLVVVLACFPCNNAKADRYPTRAELRRFLSMLDRSPGGAEEWRKHARAQAQWFLENRLLLEGE